MSKGVSPILASVLLIAVSLAVAGIFSGWAPNIVKTVTDSTTNQTDTTTDCNRAAVDIITVKYFSGDAETSVVLRNTGTIKLDKLQVSAWQDDLPMNSSTVSLDRGNFTTTNITTTSKPTSARVFSEKCSSVSDTNEDIQ